MPTTHNGTASLAGSGTLTPGRLVTHSRTAALAGTGTLGGAGGTKKVPGFAVLSGSGTLTPVPVQAAMTAPGSMSAAARIVNNAAAALSCSPAMTATGVVPMMIARPALGATALVTQRAAAVLSSSPALTAATSASAAHLSAAPVLLAPGRMGAARLLAGTSMSVSGDYFMPGQVAIFAAPVLSAAGRVTELPTVHLSASTALAASALAEAGGAAALTAPGHLTAAVQAVSAPLSGTGHLTAFSLRTAGAGATLTAPGSLSAAARVTERAAAALHAAAGISPQATVTRTLRASLSAAAALHAPAVRSAQGHAALSAPGALTAHGAHTAAARAAISGSPALSADGDTIPGAHMHAAASLSAAGKLGRAGHASLSAGASLTATARGTALPRTAWTAVSTLVSTPLGIVPGRGAFAVSPSLAALADTRPKLPFPVRPKTQQPAWQRDIQGFAIRQERQRHAQALWQYGELGVFVLLWRPKDISAGLARRCTRCFVPAATLDSLPPGTLPPPGWPTPSAESQISAAYGQGSQYRCPLCYGTQLIAAKAAQVPGVRALLVRPAILTDTDQNQQRTAKGVVNPGTVQVQSTPDFRVHTLDYFFRSDGRRYQLQVPARTTLRTGFATPWQASAGISYNLAGASLEDPKASVAYIVPPSEADLARVLGTYTRVPADFAWFEQVNGPLIPEETPPPAASGGYQPPTVLGSQPVPSPPPVPAVVGAIGDEGGGFILDEAGGFIYEESGG